MRLQSLYFIALFLISACTSDPGTAPAEALFKKDVNDCPGLPAKSKALLLTAPASILEVGASTPVDVTNQTGAAVPVCALEWTSSNNEIAAVSSAGIVTGVGAGAVTITVSTIAKKPLSAAIGLNVVVPPPDVISGLRAYFPFAGNAQDASGNGQHGTPGSGATLSADRFGNPAAAFSFAGDLGFINIGQLDLTGAFTLSAWIRADQQTVGGVISKFATANVQGYELLYAGAQQQHCMRLHTSGLRGTGGFDCTIPLDLGRWYHVVGTYDGTSVGRLYLDGVLVAELSGLLADFSGGPQTLIGRSAWGAQTFPGAIDEVRIYVRALTPEQVAYLAALQ